MRAAIEADVPASYVDLPIQDYDFRPLGNQIWEAAVHYGLKKQTNESAYTFDTGGGTAHITQAKQTIARYPRFQNKESSDALMKELGVIADESEGTSKGRSGDN